MRKTSARLFVRQLHLIQGTETNNLRISSSVSNWPSALIVSSFYHAHNPDPTPISRQRLVILNAVGID